MLQKILCFISVCTLMAESTLSAADLNKEKMRYESADKALNEVFAELKKNLPAERFEEMRKDQIDWISYRDYMSDWAGGEKGRAAIEWWETAAGLTEARIPYLKAWKGVGEDFAWAGVYEDGRGGILYIEKRGEKLHFEVVVVRGPTFHTGEISGLMQVNEHRARFSDGGINGKEAGETWLDWKQIDGNRIELEAINSQHYHGARAYFDGVYLRVDAKGVIPKEEK